MKHLCPNCGTETSDCNCLALANALWMTCESLMGGIGGIATDIDTFMEYGKIHPEDFLKKSRAYLGEVRDRLREVLEA